MAGRREGGGMAGRRERRREGWQVGEKERGMAGRREGGRDGR